MKKVRVFSMYSGVFGFEIGIERALGKENVEIVGYSQVDPQCKSETCRGNFTAHTYLYSGSAKCDVCGKVNSQYADAICQYHKPGLKNYGDATKVSAIDVPDHDLFVAGFSCQPFSIAGKKLGLEDVRGTAIYEIARVLQAKRPGYFLLENVTNLVGHDDNRTIATIHSILTGIGYICEWVVLNSKNFGVPHNRSRVFFIGHLGGKPRPEILSIGGGIPLGDGPQESGEIRDIAQCMTARQYSSWNGTYIKYAYNAKRQGDRIYQTDGLSPCLTANGGGKKSPVIIDGDLIRKLTPIETERLQSWPDNWTKFGVFNGKVKEISDSQRYKCAGNGVTSNVIEELIKIFPFDL